MKMEMKSNLNKIKELLIIVGESVIDVVIFIGDSIHIKYIQMKNAYQQWKAEDWDMEFAHPKNLFPDHGIQQIYY